MATSTGQKVVIAVAVGVGSFGCCIVTAGIVSAIAIPELLGYAREAKVAEARANLRVLSAAVDAYCSDLGRLPEPTGPVPAEPTSARQIFEPTQVFLDLGFQLADPVYYAYSIEPAPGGVRLVARGDLDADGVLSELSVACTAAPCGCSPEMVEVDSRE